MQLERKQEVIMTDYDRKYSTLLTTFARNLIPEFIFTKSNLAYALSPDWDNRWKTSGTLEEIHD